MGKGEEEAPLVSFRVLIAPEALKSLDRIGNRANRSDIEKRIGNLAGEPEKKGKPLVADLAGFRSLRVGRYRIIYRVHRDRVEVIVVGVGKRSAGSRDDIYALAKKLIRLHLTP